jgi:hypothetical protein
MGVILLAIILLSHEALKFISYMNLACSVRGYV